MTVEDATVCNDEKLASGSTAAYVSSAELFLKETIFGDGDERGAEAGTGRAWPTVVFAPSNMVDDDEAPNLQIDVSQPPRGIRWQSRARDVCVCSLEGHIFLVFAALTC